jgi:hypothetical protein
MLGDENERVAFLGNAARMERNQVQLFRSLVEVGVLPAEWGSPQTEFDDFDSVRWNYDEVFDRAASLLQEAGLVSGSEHIYDTLYRALSNRLGAHPTPHVLDKYVDTEGAFIRVFRAPNFEGLGTFWSNLPRINFVSSFVLVILYALNAATRLEVDTRPFIDVLGRYETLRVSLEPFLRA